MVRRMLVAVTAAVALTAMMVASAGAATVPAPGRIGPNQIFIGLVNGRSGIGSPAQVRVACPGPVRSGELTHPLAHQPLEVVLPAAIATKSGDTGADGTRITAYLGVPPTPSTVGPLATFHRYDVRKRIPTSATVPCSGSGFITFVPFPRDPASSRSFVVPIEFVNIAV